MPAAVPNILSVELEPSSGVLLLSTASIVEVVVSFCVVRVVVCGDDTVTASIDVVVGVVVVVGVMTSTP